MVMQPSNGVSASATGGPRREPRFYAGRRPAGATQLAAHDKFSHSGLYGQPRAASVTPGAQSAH